MSAVKFVKRKRENDPSFCKWAYDMRKVKSGNQDISFLFSSDLDEENAIQYGPFLFLYSDKNDKDSFENIITNEILTQIKVYSERKICRTRIDQSFINSSIGETRHIFSATIDKDSENSSCSVIAFRLMKEYTPKLLYLKNYSSIVSILICAMPGSRGYDSRTNTVYPISLVDEKLKNVKAIKSGIGIILTYMSARWAKKKGYKYYIIKAASYALTGLYMKWGFHVGIPEINLDSVVMNKMKEIDAQEEYTTKKISEEKKEEELMKVMRREIQRRFQDDSEFAKMIGMNDEYIEEQKYAMDPFGDECDTVMKDIVKKGDTYKLYIDLSDDNDMERLKRYGYNKFYEYTTVNGKYTIEDEEYRELF